MAELCDLQVHVNSHHTFFVNEDIISKFSGKLRRIIKQEKRRIQIRNSGIEIVDFPGGPYGFELASRFCYNRGRITITVSNVSLLHCSALFLGMTQKNGASPNLFEKTQDFLQSMFYWSWNDVITCLKSCESFFSYAESSPSDLIQKLMNSLSAKIAQNSDVNLITSSYSSSSSPDTPASGITRSNSNSSKKTWWFNDLTILPPQIIESLVKTLGGYGSDNNSLVLTRFLLHYLKSSPVKKTQKKSSSSGDGYFGNIADTAVHGVIWMGKSSFSCRGLLSVLRVVSGFGLSRECRFGLERLIGGALDEATLDDLLVSSSCGVGGVVYDVNLVVRLIRVFVHENTSNKEVVKMKKVGRLVDKYLGEIAPDHNLKIAKFLGVAESLPDFARDCFDGVYRAIDTYLQSHPTLSVDERSRICRCLNYEKLSLEACKDLARSPRIPPRIAVQALASQHPLIITNLPPTETDFDQNYYYETTPTFSPLISNSIHKEVVYKRVNSYLEEGEEEDKNEEDTKLNLQRMQWRVVELERECREMKGKMSRIVKNNTTDPPRVSYNYRGLPRLC
ncbi:hypothetical protein RHGRI_026327 [Rhododendron griersonianum]|uniref:NPH3 domain-containing protein n=1 Tax=Rhododendron griersonianum TaxID=479676 RepID=A0AAV6ISI4_9ERIC|nr:hypothetical protein RHGRI_026327 [Rhododendron griersonianum]